MDIKDGYGFGVLLGDRPCAVLVRGEIRSDQPQAFGCTLDDGGRGRGIGDSTGCPRRLSGLLRPEQKTPAS